MPHGEGDTTVTNTRGPDERLRDAFQAIDDPVDADLPEELRDRIWRAVSGELPVAEREALVDRMAAEPAVAEAWRVAYQVWQASAAAAPAVTTTPATRWTPSWLAAAAVLLLCTSLGVFTLLNRSQGGDEFRAAPGIVVESLISQDARLPRDAFRLRWTPGPTGARYQVRVTTEDLQVLATAADLPTAEFLVDREVLVAVPPGGRVLWQVDVVSPDGARQTSATFVTVVE